VLTVAIPTVTVLVAILVNNGKLDQLSRHIDQQVTGLRNELNARITSLRVEIIAPLERLERVLDALLKLFEEILKVRRRFLGELAFSLTLAIC
jgi:hypothetical protein